jgi:hypothetical protein
MNWDEDERPLIAIPEARDYCKVLWAEGKQLLRLLTASTHNTPKEDRHGLTQEELMQFGLGWWDIYCVGKNAIGWMLGGASPSTPNHNLDGEDAWQSAFTVAHNDLFAGLDRGITGYTPEDAVLRHRLHESLTEYIEAFLLAKKTNGLEGNVVVALSLGDEQGVLIASQLQARDPDGQMPGMTLQSESGRQGYKLCLIEAGMAVEVLAGIAPEVANAIGTTPLLPNEVWSVVVASGGTQMWRHEMQ